MEVYLSEGTTKETDYKRILQRLGGVVRDSNNWRDKFEDLTWNCFISLIILHNNTNNKYIDFRAGIDIGLCKFNHMLMLIIINPFNDNLRQELEAELGTKNVILMDHSNARIAIMRISSLMNYIAIDQPDNPTEIQKQVNCKKKWRRNTCNKIMSIYTETIAEKEEDRNDFRASYRGKR